MNLTTELRLIPRLRKDGFVPVLQCTGDKFTMFNVVVFIITG